MKHAGGASYVQKKTILFLYSALFNVITYLCICLFISLSDFSCSYFQQSNTKTTQKSFRNEINGFTFLFGLKMHLV